MTEAVPLRIEQHGEVTIASRIVGFARFLRDKGFPIGVHEGLDALRLVRTGDWRDADAVRLGLKALLCASDADWRRYDELFDAYWRRRGMRRMARIAGATSRRDKPTLAGSGEPGNRQQEADRLNRGDEDDLAAGGEGRQAGASTMETLYSTDLRHIHDPEEMALVYDLADRLARRLRYRMTRRHRIAARGRHLDLRKTIHRSIRHGGTPLQLAFRKRRVRPPRLVLLLDASGSMSQYSAFFIRFISGVVDRFRDAEAFIFHTRLIHLSDALKERDPVKAAERLDVMTMGWAGGTKIGESLATFNRQHAERVLNSRTIVVIVSDGYDTGEPEALAAQLARIQKRARRVVWLNPMIGWDGYEPVAGGMAAALPYTDLFAPAHNLESLAALEPYFAKL